MSIVKEFGNECIVNNPPYVWAFILTWDAVDGADSYKVYSNVTNEVVADGITETQCNIRDEMPGNHIGYEDDDRGYHLNLSVIAVNQSGESEPSNITFTSQGFSDSYWRWYWE